MRGTGFQTRLGWMTAAAGLVATISTGPVIAAPKVQRRTVSRGVDRPIHDLSAEGDATSIEVNPAMLSAIRGIDVALMGYQATSDFVRGSGFGGFIAANLRFGLALGFGAQFMQPRLGNRLQDFDQTNNPTSTKLTWALSGGLGEKGAFGLALSGIRAGGSWLRRPDLDLGAMARIRNRASLGVTLRFGPGDLRDDTYANQLAGAAEVAIRPLGTRTLELAGGFTQILAESAPGSDLKAPSGTSGLLPRGRIALRWHGIGLLGEVEQVRTTVIDELSLAPLRNSKAVRGSVAIDLAWDYARGRVGLHAGVGDGVDGVGFAAHIGTSRQDRVYWPRAIGAERIALADVQGEHDLIDLLQRLQRAKAAGNRTVVVVEPKGADLGWAALHELREELVDIRTAGGHVFAYLDNAGLKDYYIASVAEKVYLHPAGALATYGLVNTQLYFRRMLDKLGVQAEVVRVDDFKSAAERFTNTEPSAADRLQRNELLSDIFGVVVGDIARARNLPKGEVEALVGDAPHGPQVALSKHLVDEILYRDQLLETIGDHIGTPVQFRALPDTNHAQPTWSTAPYVAVVVVEGMIVDGESRFIPLINLRFAGGDTIASTIEKVREDPSCKGIVVRVNSPGGSALASDVIWREVVRTDEAHRKSPRFSPPIVVSMGETAASGGYYLATGTHTVLADPLTVTGSIGVISMHFDLSGLLAKVGIDVTTLRQGNNGDIMQPWHPLTDDQRKRLTREMELVYGRFVDHVAAGRNLSSKRVRELAGGRVYSGMDAHAVGLVDRMGGLDDAIALVREQAAVPSRVDLEVRVVPEPTTLIDLLLHAIGLPDRSERRPRSRRRQRRGTMELLGVDLAAVRGPLSLMFLPSGQVHALMPWTW